MKSGLGIVLCHEADEKGILSSQTKERVDVAIKLYDEGIVSELIMSGGYILGYDFSVAEKMRDYASHKTSAKISLEELSLDTVGQLVFLKEGIIDPRKIKKFRLVVHSRYQPKTEFMAYSIFDESYEISFSTIQIPCDAKERREDFLKLPIFLNGFCKDKPENYSLTEHLVKSHPWYSGMYPHADFTAEYFLDGLRKLKIESTKIK